MKKLIIGVLIALITSISAFSQSSAQIDTILNSETVSLAQISYLPALYKNLISDNDSEQKAFEALQNEGFFSDDDSADSSVTLAKACGVLVKALDIKGGLFYSLFHSDRYAYKELKANDVVPATSNPTSTISGRDFIDLFNSCLELIGDN